MNKECEYCNNTGYIKSNSAEYEGPCLFCSKGDNYE